MKVGMEVKVKTEIDDFFEILDGYNRLWSHLCKIKIKSNSICEEDDILNILWDVLQYFRSLG